MAEIETIVEPDSIGNDIGRESVAFICVHCLIVPILAFNLAVPWRGLVTPARRGKGKANDDNIEVKSPAEHHVAMTWAQRLKRVFNIDIEVCSRCGGSVRAIACIEDQDIIDRILAHLRSKEQTAPTRPLLVPPSRAPPATPPLFAGSESTTTSLNQQGG